MSFNEALRVCMLNRFSCVQFFATLWTMARLAPLSIGFNRHKYWSELPCPPPENLPHPGIEPASPAAPALQADSLWLNCLGSPRHSVLLGQGTGKTGLQRVRYLQELIL